MEERVVDENQEFLSSLLVFLSPLCWQLFHLKAPSITETSQGFTTKHLSPSTAEKPSVSTLHSNAPIPGTYIGNKWWHMGAYRPVPSWRFFLFQTEIFPPFSLASGWVFSGMWGGERGRDEVCLLWGLLCTCRSFTTFYKLFQQRERDFKKEGRKWNLQNVSVREKEKEGWRGVDEGLVLITHRSGHYQPAERLYKTITNGDHQSVHQ